MSDEQWDAMIDIHASAQFRILRAYGRWLRGNAGSTRQPAKSSTSPPPWECMAAPRSSHPAGKAAVVGINKTLAANGDFNVNWHNAVQPLVP